MELQTAFYVIGIVYMVLMTVIVIAMLVALLVIKAKINKLHNMVNDRVDQAKALTGKMALGLGVLKHLIRK